MHRIRTLLNTAYTQIKGKPIPLYVSLIVSVLAGIWSWQLAVLLFVGAISVGYKISTKYIALFICVLLAITFVTSIAGLTEATDTIALLVYGNLCLMLLLEIGKSMMSLKLPRALLPTSQFKFKSKEVSSEGVLFIGWGVAIGLAIGLFRYNGLVASRDIIWHDYFYNIRFSLNPITLLQFMSNLLADAGLDPRVFYSLVIQLIFISGCGLALSSWYTMMKRKGLVSWIGIPISIAYMYNAFIFNRLMMGQILVLAGHSLSPLGLILYKREAWLRYSFALAISIVSIHHGVFWFIVFFIKDFYRRRYSIPLLSGCAFLLLQRIKFAGGGQTIQDQVFSSPQNIELFAGQSNPYIGSFLSWLLGANSWMANSFFELDQIRTDLGSLADLSYVFSPQAGFVVAFLFLGASFISIWNSDHSTEDYKRAIIFLVGMLVCLILSSIGSETFGLSQIYQYIPLSSVFRETMKWYGFLLILSLGFIAQLVNRGKFQAQWIVASVFIAISGLLAFLPLAANTNTFSRPASWVQAAEICEDRKVVALPIETYFPISTAPAVFAPNPYQQGLACNTVEFEKIHLESGIVLQKNANAQRVNEIFSLYQQGIIETPRLIDLLAESDVDLVWAENVEVAGSNLDYSLIISRLELDIEPVINDGVHYLFDLQDLQ